MTIVLYLLSLLLVQQPVQPASGSLSGQLRGDNGAPAAGIRIAAAPVEGDLAIAQAPTELSNIVQTDREGRYRLENVRPGRYFIIAGSLTSPSYYPGGTTPDKGRIVTVIAGQEITRLDFTIATSSTVIAGGRTPSSAITGSARFDDGTPLASGMLKKASLEILFHKSGGGQGGTAQLNYSQPGVLDISSVYAPGTYTVIVAPLPLGYYLQSITFGNVDLTRNALDLKSSQGNPPLTVVLSKKRPAGTLPGVNVSGRVTNQNPVEPKLGIRSIAFNSVWDTIQQRQESTQVALVDILDDGSFEINDVPPGRYFLSNELGPRPVTFDVGRNDVTNLEVKIGKPEYPVTLTSSTNRTLQGTVEVADGIVPEFEIQFVPAREGGETRSVNVSRKEFSALLPEGAYRVRISGLPTGYVVGSVVAGPLDLSETFLVTAGGVADRFTGVAMRSAPITVKLTRPTTN